MSSSVTLQINGKNRSFPGLSSAASLADLIAALELKADRVAVELNGEIAPRMQWGSLTVKEGDKVEVVHFVGGGKSRHTAVAVRLRRTDVPQRLKPR
jgi:sulfur carrier protein